MPTYSWPGVYVEEVPSAVKPIAGVGTSTAAFIGVSTDIIRRLGSGELRQACRPVPLASVYTQVAALTPQAVNSWTEFTQNFGDIQAGNQYLAQAVYGFFNNGGTRCWVTRIGAAGNDLEQALQQLESIDEIAIVAAPLPPDTAAAALNAAQDALVDALPEDGGPGRDPGQRPRHHRRQPGRSPPTRRASGGPPPTPRATARSTSPGSRWRTRWARPATASRCRRAATWPASMRAATPSAGSTRRPPTRSSWARSTFATRSARSCRAA